jgi:hypothetical protein
MRMYTVLFSVVVGLVVFAFVLPSVKRKYGTYLSNRATMEVCAGVIWTMLLYIIVVVILRVRTIAVFPSAVVKPKQTTVIVKGYAPLSYFKNRVYNTYDSLADNFRLIGRSVNTHGGAQLTYRFWVRINDVDDKYYKNMIVMNKGDEGRYKIGLYHKNTNAFHSTLSDGSRLVMGPMIQFVDSYRHMRIHFNTNKNPLTHIDVRMDGGSGDDVTRKNVMSLLPNTWSMLTFILEDGRNDGGAENGIQFQFWLNDFPYQVTDASSDRALYMNTLVSNDGNLHLFPNDAMMNGHAAHFGDFTYHNYALNAAQIRDAYRKGPPRKPAENELKRDNGSMITAFNKIDVYNY